MTHTHSHVHEKHANYKTLVFFCTEMKLKLLFGLCKKKKTFTNKKESANSECFFSVSLKLTPIFFSELVEKKHFA